MHILVITPTGKTVKIDVKDDDANTDMNPEETRPLGEPKIMDKYPTTSEEAQLRLQQLDFIDKLSKFPNNEAKHSSKTS